VVLPSEIDALVSVRAAYRSSPASQNGAVEVLAIRFARARAGPSRPSGKQREKVDVRARRQLATAIPAGGDERERNRFGARETALRSR